MSFIIASNAESLSFFQKFGIQWDMLISQAIMFTLLAIIMYRFVFKPVASAAEARRTAIKQGLDDAAVAQLKLKECEKECSLKISNAAIEASNIIANTRDDAKAMIEKAASDASKRASEIIEKAKIEIAGDRAKMKDELKGEIAELVVKTAEAVFADSLSAETKSKIANETVSKLSGE